MQTEKQPRKKKKMTDFVHECAKRQITGKKRERKPLPPEGCLEGSPKKKNRNQNTKKRCSIVANLPTLHCMGIEVDVTRCHDAATQRGTASGT